LIPPPRASRTLPAMIARPQKSLAGCFTAALLIAVAPAGCGSAKRPAASTSAVQAGAGGFAGAALPSGLPAPALTLRDQAGHSTSLAALRGQVAIVAFLYTRCGSPCTVIAQQIRGALDDLAGPVPALIVSADPAA